VFQCVGWVGKRTPPLSKSCWLYFSLSAGWRGGLRHYPNHAGYISVCRLGGEEDSATIQIMLAIFQCVGWVARITPPLSKSCWLYFSVSAGWRGGLRHYPDPVTAPDLQQAREQQPHLPLQAQQPRQYLLSFHFRFFLPVFYFQLFLLLVPLSLKTSRIPLPVFSTNVRLFVLFFSSFYASCFLHPDFHFHFPASGYPLPVGPQRVFSLSFYSVPRCSISLYCTLRASSLTEQKKKDKITGLLWQPTL
jgi:hypothetical protein